MPFKAYRPPPTVAPSLAAPPYDVINSEEARKMADGNEHSFLRVGENLSGWTHYLPVSNQSTLLNELKWLGPSRSRVCLHLRLQVNKPEIDLPASISSYDLRVYERGAR